MADKTIKELAEELGVSKTAINKKVSDKKSKTLVCKKTETSLWLTKPVKKL